MLKKISLIAYMFNVNVLTIEKWCHLDSQYNVKFKTTRPKDYNKIVAQLLDLLQIKKIVSFLLESLIIIKTKQ